VIESARNYDAVVTKMEAAEHKITLMNEALETSQLAMRQTYAKMGTVDAICEQLKPKTRSTLQGVIMAKMATKKFRNLRRSPHKTRSRDGPRLKPAMIQPRTRALSPMPEQHTV